jgi:borealin
MPDVGEECKDMDLEHRREKVQTLLKDFKTEMDSRLQRLETCANDILRQIDLSYSVEMLKLPPQYRSMKLKDFLKAGGVFEAVPSGDALADKLKNLDAMLANENSSFKSMQLSTINESANSKAASRSVKRKENVGPPQTTSRHGKKTKSGVCETPANGAAALFQWNTPIITPKFDPRLFQTPAAVEMRGIKPGEVIVSMDGSPLLNTDNNAQPAGQVVEKQGQKFVMVPVGMDVSSMDFANIDSNSIEGAFNTLQQMKAVLDNITRFPNN